MRVTLSQKGFEELKQAVLVNPSDTKKAVSNFLVRGLAAMRKTIISHPWRMGDSGGGAPVNTRNLVDTHQQQVNPWDAFIGPSMQAAPYAAYVHGIDGWPRKRNYQLRPWLDYAVMANERKMEELEGQLLEEIVAGLV